MDFLIVIGLFSSQKVVEVNGFSLNSAFTGMLFGQMVYLLNYYAESIKHLCSEGSGRTLYLPKSISKKDRMLAARILSYWIVTEKRDDISNNAENGFRPAECVQDVKGTLIKAIGQPRYRNKTLAEIFLSEKGTLNGHESPA